MSKLITPDELLSIQSKQVNNEIDRINKELVACAREANITFVDVSLSLRSLKVRYTIIQILKDAGYKVYENDLEKRFRVQVSWGDNEFGVLEDE